jgi:hypothetical protein
VHQLQVSDVPSDHCTVIDSDIASTSIRGFLSGTES